MGYNSMAVKRELKGIDIVKNGSVMQIDTSRFRVCSQSDPSRWYEVNWQRNRWKCACADYAKRRTKCKHIHAVNYYLAVKDIVLLARRTYSNICCPMCNYGDDIIKKGVRYNRNGPVQLYLCKRCRRKFTATTGLGRMKRKATTIAVALDLYYRGLSLRQVAQHLESSYGVKVTHATIYYWIKKYVEMVSGYLQHRRVMTSERWHADDTYLRVRGRHLTLWALLDSDTRLLLAMHVSQRRGEADAKKIFEKGLETSENRPLEVVTDGLPSYASALKTLKIGDEHPVIHLQGPLSEAMNNKMERFYGTLKSRVRNMCGFESEESARRFAEGFWIYYNFIKPHAALAAKTPAERAGLASRKSWLELILDAGDAVKQDTASNVAVSPTQPLAGSENQSLVRETCSSSHECVNNCSECEEDR